MSTLLEKVNTFKQLQRAGVAATRVGGGQIYVYASREVEVNGMKVVAIIHNHTLLGYATKENGEWWYVGFNWTSSTSKSALGRVRNMLTGGKAFAHVCYFGECSVDVNTLDNEDVKIEQETVVYALYKEHHVCPMFDAYDDNLLIRK